MNNTYSLTEDQLDFIAFMKWEVKLCPELNRRLTSCLNGIASCNPQNEKTNPKRTLYHSPHTMIEFLSLFSRDDRFKWYTHKWDVTEPLDIKAMESKQKSVAKNVLNEMVYPKQSGPVVNERTYNQVWNFINFMNTGPNIYPWKNTKLENIKIGWHSIINLSKDKPEMPVDYLILENGHQFKDYIRMFKAVIEFRTDLKDDDIFSELISEAITSTLPKDFNIKFSKEFYEVGYELNVYCDVVAILSALNIICDWIIRYKTRSSKVNVDLICDKDYYILEIYHEGSYFNNIEKLRNSSGDFENLRQRLFSVCDLTLEGDYIRDGKEHGSLIVTALDEGTKIIDKALTSCVISERDKRIGGVKYQLKIYKR